MKNSNLISHLINMLLEKRFNGEPETIEDYLKRGGTVTKLKDEPEILLEIEMML